MATVTVLNNGYHMASTDPVQNAMNMLASVIGSGNSTQRNYNAPFESLINRGAFSSLNGDGDPTKGTLTSFDHTTNFGSLMGIRVADLSLSVPTLFTWVQTGNAAAMTNAVFGGADTFSGFAVADDIIHLDRAVFGAINAGALDADAFFIGAAAADAEDRIICDDTTGALYYDEDGDGAAAALLFANLGAGLGLTGADFFSVGP